MNYFSLTAAVVLPLLFVSCGGTSVPPITPPSKKVEIKPVKKEVVYIREKNEEVKRELALAKREIEEAKKEAEEAKSLVKKMKEAESPFHSEVEKLRKGYETKINTLTSHLDKSEKALDEQKEANKKAEDLLSQAEVDLAKFEKTEESLRNENIELRKAAQMVAKHKEFYDTRWERHLKIIGYTLLAVVIFVAWQRLKPSGLASSFASGILNARK